MVSTVDGAISEIINLNKFSFAFCYLKVSIADAMLSLIRDTSIKSEMAISGPKLYDCNCSYESV